MTDLTPFEEDILEQPAALRRLIEPEFTAQLAQLAAGTWDRIVFTGMGSSYFAGIPTWRSLTAHGRDAWVVDAGQLLDTPDLLTANTLLVATSQSGASGEVVELLDRARGGTIRLGHLVGIAADEDSPLAAQADLFLPLRSGNEATVSTKSYLNTLALHRRISAAFANENPDVASTEIDRTASLVASQITAGVDGRLAANILEPRTPRLAAVGKRDDAATALYAALITKESSKVAIEGYIGGQFRHGPFELAGPGMTAFIYGAHHSADDDTLSRLAADLLETGATTVLVGDLEIPEAVTLKAPGGSPLASLSTGAVAAQLLAVQLARVNQVVPGAFAFGSKVTTAL
jgi:fructoselysine-6-P-deglycase FrlB-like protein